MNGLMAVTRSAKERLPMLYLSKLSALHSMLEQGVSTNMAALWYKRRHRYVDNQRVKQKVALPTIAMAKFALDSLESR